jgi:hypothetical protein
LGAPVVPDVKITDAVSSGPTTRSMGPAARSTSSDHDVVPSAGASNTTISSRLGTEPAARSIAT